MINVLGDYDLPDPIFIDANVFLHHAYADSEHGENAQRFLERVEIGEVKALTSVLVENEVLFKIVLQEAANHIAHPSAWNVRQALQDDPGFRTRVYRPAKRYLDYLHTLAEIGLTLVDATVGQTQQAIAIGERFGLLITDATHVATWRAYDIVNVATDDEDLGKIPGVTVWSP